MKKYFISLLCAVLLPAAYSFAQDFKPAVDSVRSYLIGKTTVRSSVAVESATMDRRGTLHINLRNGIVDFPLRDESVEAVYSIFRENLPDEFKNCKKIEITADNIPMEKLKSNFYASKQDQAPLKEHLKAEKKHRSVIPLVRNESRPNRISKGLQTRHIAMWQSHGWYYEPKLKRWEMQRARCWETVEDLYTQSYVLPFLVPMLENAGAVVMLPRERDWNKEEVIVDNDDIYATYRETGSWSDAPGAGFANPKASYTYKENPFLMGSARMAQAASKKVGTSVAQWIPSFSKEGTYAVYVSYKTVSNSATDAHYTVRHKGGETNFKVNQQMGGSTWIFLGKFEFDKGNNFRQGVFLTNESENPKAVITADAVKFGGGMGNMARKPATEDKDGKKIDVDFDIEPEVSGYPRFTEGARYWLQWAGYNDTIYSYSFGVNDYNDDYMSRPRWVNALIGGSYLAPDKPGYNIPVDLSFAFHTDAGNSLDDSIVGSLAIYTRLSNDSDRYSNGESRLNARELSDLVQTEICNDVRANYAPEWNRRLLWDRSYAESRIPDVPAMLLELLSHHNLADMRYGLDPSFRFTVSRAIYKGMLKYLAYINQFDYCVQPLPVNSFESRLDGNTVRLSWAPTPDPAEPTASPSSYIVYTRKDNGGFDNGTPVSGTEYSVQMEEGHIYSFKVAAVNDGGSSFPSETLSAGIASAGARKALVINNFDRVSAPVSFASRDSMFAGFQNGLDAGVAYLEDISFIGPQYEFRRLIPWMDDDSCGFGSSSSEYETEVIAGNTFDYPYAHGKALMAAGYSFCSASRTAVNNGKVSSDGYSMVDVICGKQITTQVGRPGFGKLKYAIFTPEIQQWIRSCTSKGVNILITGANIGSDVWEPVFGYTIDEKMKKEVVEPARKFVTEVLHYQWMTNQATKVGKACFIQNPLGFRSGKGKDSDISFPTGPNGKVYGVEAPDGIVPAGEGAFSVMRYTNSISAAVAYKGSYKVFAMGIPLETASEEEQKCIMKKVTAFFED